MFRLLVHFLARDRIHRASSEARLLFIRLKIGVSRLDNVDITRTIIHLLLRHLKLTDAMDRCKWREMIRGFRRQ